MATEDGREGPGLIGHLAREPHRFDFFQAVRLLEMEHRQRQRPPEGPRAAPHPVGGDGPPGGEAVQFRASPSLGFPAGSIGQIRRPAPADPAAETGVAPGPTELGVTFLGLFGAAGVLPHHYTSLLIRRVRDKDFSLRDFLDLFNHRAVSLFYRAWEKYRLPFLYERFRSRPRSRPDVGGREADPCTHALYCLVGLGTDGLRGRLEFDDEAFLYYGGHFAHFPRSAAALGQILEDYFGTPVAVQQVRGQWLALDPGEQSRLPGASRGVGGNNRLGVDAIAGARVWDVQSKFRLRVGPLSYAQFRALMPSGDALRPLCQLARTYVGPGLDFDVQPVLAPDEVPWCQLGGGGDGDGPFLGWNTWVRCRPFTHEVSGPAFPDTEAR